VSSGAFSRAFQEAIRDARSVAFSAHARERMARRGIDLTSADEDRIGRAVDQAAAKGARESLLLMDNCALVVSVAHRRVITVVPTRELDDAVFTNIDSAVIVAPEAPKANGEFCCGGPVPSGGGPDAAE